MTQATIKRVKVVEQEEGRLRVAFVVDVDGKEWQGEAVASDVEEATRILLEMVRQLTSEVP